MIPHPPRRSARKSVRALAALMALAAVLPASSATARTEHRPDLARHFAAAGTSGTMVVLEEGPRRDSTVVVDAARSHRRYLPSSTFKIPNALIALDEGVVSGPDHPFPGPNPNFELDGAPLLPASCEGDLTLATALASSCIPIFQRLARAIGLPAYERALRSWRYGNRRIRDASLDAFWLEGPFGISAHEQVRFLRRLRRGTLPLPRRTMRQVRAMLLAERRDGVALHAKSGYVFTTAPRVGWWVGWVERGARAWTFALNLDMTRPEHFAARTRVGRAVLSELGAWGA